MIKSRLLQSLTVCLAATLVLFLFYGNVMVNLNSIVFSGSGDGLKNYYTYLYHAKYDQNFWDFTGMNYPFYEHIVYTDAHPLLSYLIGQLGLADYGIGILNFLMLVSYPISAVLIYKILRHYAVSINWSMVASIVVCFMAPQIFRLTGHLSLSYVFAIPLMWLLLIKVETTRRIIWSILISLLLFGFFFTHPYLGLILAVFGLAYALVFWWFKKSDWLFYGLKVVLPILGAIVIFQLIVNVTDTHIDRMKTPAGFFDYYAKWNSLLVSHHGPMNWIKHALGFRMSGWESWTYIGFSTLVFLVIGIVYYINHRQVLSLKAIFSTSLGKLYLVGHLVLLFSFCFPLKYEGLRWIADVLGPLKQFRVLGRFAWVYFYIVSIVAIVILVKIRKKSSRQLSWDFVFYIGMLFTIFEFSPAHIGVSKSISRTENPFQEKHLSHDLKAVIEWTNTQDYDAIMFLPFNHFSSENTFILGAEKANADAMMLSFHTHIPLMNTITSRTSVTESILYQNLFSPEFIEKELANYIGSDKKIMLIKNKDGLDFNELRMIWTADEIFKNDTYTIYDFSFEKWNTPSYFKAVLAAKDEANYALESGWFSDTSDQWFIYDSFDALPEVNSMTGSGAFAGQKMGINVIKDQIAGLSNGQYICSFWYNIRVDRADQLAVIEQRFTNGTGKWVAQDAIRETNLIVGDWAYVELPFEVSDTVEMTKLFLSGNKSKQWFVIDELLIRKRDGHHLFKTETLNDEPYIIYDNFWIKANSFSK